MRAFCLVVEEGSFAAAARALNVSPTMVSRYVKQLEENLGCLLFKRNTRKVYLTKAGEQYRQHIRPLIKRIDIIENQLTEYSLEPTGKLAISASIEFGGLYLAKLVQNFKSAYAKIDIDVMLSNEPIDLFDSNIDLVFRVAPSLPNASHIALPICQSRLSLWASPSYIKRHGEPKNLDDLKGHSLLFFNHSIRKDHWIFQVNNQRLAMKLNWQLSSNNGRLLNEAAVNGMGIIQAPQYSVAPYLATKQLVEVLPEYQINPLTISAIYPHRFALSSHIETFVKYSKQYFLDNPIP